MANTVVEATVLHATDEYVDFVHLSWSELARRTWREVIEDDVLGLAAQLSYVLLSRALSGHLVLTRSRELFSSLQHYPRRRSLSRPVLAEKSVFVDAVELACSDR